jgi:hypothetical protein
MKETGMARNEIAKYKILVGTPTIKPDLRFLASLSQFIFEASKNFDVTYRMIRDRPLYEAENALAKEAMEGDYDYLLFLEDDHWGFTVEDLERLFVADKPVIALPYFSRHFPYQMTAMNLKETVSGYGTEPLNIYEPQERSGLSEVDLTGFGFTLIKTDVLHSLSDPIFFPTEYCSKATDQWFYRKLLNELGLRPWVSFEHVLAHRDITLENVEAKRREFIESNSMYRRNILLGKTGNSRIKRILEDKKAHRFEVSA